MIRRFAEFELDDARRELRLRGREIPLQPRVFDLLDYLVSHEGRVVGKTELLDQLWPGVIVTDASLQRAVSLARAALQEGGLREAIRTHSRRGYRFCLPQVDEPAPAPSTAPPPARDAAEDAYRRHAWAAAMQQYALADARQLLDARSLEHWAISAQCTGQLAQAVAPLERAAIAYSASGHREAAARATIGLARLRLESMEPAIAHGCLQRAERLLAGLPTSAPHGYLRWMQARFQLFEGRLDEALVRARDAEDIGRALQNCDIETMGLLCQGIALQAQGQTRRGAELQDESAAAVVSGNVSPLIGGLVYCGLIAGCCNRGDWRRAEQWTESFTHWCRRSGIDSFAGACMLHRAEVFAACGELDRARDEIHDADRLLSISAPWAIGDLQRLRGDLHLMRGEFDAAETAYHMAYADGWDPYPGYAMLQHYRGRTEEAIRGLLRCAEQTTWAVGERRACYLAHAALLAGLAGAVPQARDILAQLEAHPEQWELGAVAGQVMRARAETVLAEGRDEEAIRLLRRALHCFQEMHAPLEAAVVRLRLAELLCREGDVEGAGLELGGAEPVFRRAQAAWMLERCSRLRASLGRGLAPSRAGRPLAP